MSSRRPGTKLILLVNTPVTTAVPYFQISVEFGNTDYVRNMLRVTLTKSCLRSKPGENVQAGSRMHFLYLKRPDGTE